MAMRRDWLKQVRGEKGFTQEELASKISVTRQHISLIENSVTTPSVDVAKKIASVLGFSWTLFYNSQDGNEKSHKKGGQI